MLAEGIYRIDYHGRAGGEGDDDCALAILRNGHIMGSDKHGGVFLGQYLSDPEMNRDVVTIRLEVPPGGTLITGLSAGAFGVLVDISAVFEPRTGATKTVVEIGGQAIDIELCFIGPLPN
jgi:hypothetical protein